MKENTINFKEKLNNNQISNKSNLPTTWTKKKMASLLLMSWLSVNGVEAGQAFKNCLASYADNTSYESLSDYFSKNNATHNPAWRYQSEYCCNNSGCQALPGFSPSSNSLKCFWCTGGFNNSVYCFRDDNTCGGIIGNKLINSNSSINVSGCSFNDTTNAIANLLLTPDLTSINVNNNGFAWWNCSNEPPCNSGYWSCNWDNGGWTCAKHETECYYQWPASWPGPADKNPLLATTSTSSLTSSPTSINSSPTPPISSSSSSESSNSSNLPLYIGVSVGGAVLVVGVSGIVYWKSRSKWVGNKSNKEVIEDVKKNPKEWEYKEVVDAEENISPWLIRRKNIKQKGTYIDVESGNGKWAFKKERFSSEQWTEIEQANNLLQASMVQPAK